MKYSRNTLDFFSCLPIQKIEENFLNSKRILKIILKDNKIFIKSENKGISAIKFLTSDPYLFFRMTLKKFGDPSAVWMIEFIFSYFDKNSTIPAYKYLLEKSIKLKTKNELKKRILETLDKKVFGDFKEVFWNKNRNKGYLVKCLTLSMIKQLISK